MKNVVKIVGVVAVFALLFLFDVISSDLVPEAEAIAGVRRRTARRTAVVVGSASAAQVSAANANAAASQQQAAAAQQEAADANAQAAAAQQQAAAAQQQAAAPAPTAMVASLPSGCVSAGALFQCGNVYYKPYMSGNQIVYGVVPGP
jgi:multidrug efflux pump subunit AcrA (membrane-fusion protein)